MQTKEFLNNVCQQIKYKPIRGEIAEELENHINEMKESYIENGNESSVAEEKSIEQMGDPIEIGKSLNKIHRPKVDWKLLIISIIVLSFGFLVAVTRNITYEAGLYVEESQKIFNAPIVFSISCIIGILLSIGVYFSNYKKLQKFATITYILATIIGIFINCFGTIYIPFLGIKRQIPKILPLLLYIVSFAGFIQNIKENKDIIKFQINNLKIKDSYLKIGKIIVLSIFSLIVLASTSDSIILGLSYLIIGTVKLLQVNTNKKKNIVILWLIPIVLTILYFGLYIGVFHNDIRNFTYKYSNDSWIEEQQKNIIDSAQIYGTGENDGTIAEFYNQGTNQVFLSIVANYGWIIGLILIAIVVGFSIMLIINSIKIKDIYGKMIVIGISSNFILQSLFNLIANTNFGIRTDLNIPFISYGGFELIINIVALGLIFSIYRKKDLLVSINKCLNCN